MEMPYPGVGPGVWGQTRNSTPVSSKIEEIQSVSHIQGRNMTLARVTVVTQQHDWVKTAGTAAE